MVGILIGLFLLFVAWAMMQREWDETSPFDVALAFIIFNVLLGGIGMIVVGILSLFGVTPFQ